MSAPHPKAASGSNPSALADAVVQWQAVHGRNDLPWQNTQDPYRVWLSEIMLQQTQVVTVLTYYARFLARCPDVGALASASLDEVLGLWSGLGYYTRARNLHRCAQRVVAEHGGDFPRSAQTLQTLPGIGRSTAAAISSLCFGERVAILDANVKRVVTRVLGFDADLAKAANERDLWQAATGLLPAPAQARKPQVMQRYTQGMMDLGATVCLPKKPLCLVCPVQALCAAKAIGQPEKYPVRSRSLKRSSESLWLLWAHRADGAVWLSKRPTPGVWAGLYCLPLQASVDALLLSLAQGLAPTQGAAPDLGSTPLLTTAFQKKLNPLPVLQHVLTHKDLYLHPMCVVWPDKSAVDAHGKWFLRAQWQAAGLPAPIRKLLEQGPPPAFCKA